MILLILNDLKQPVHVTLFLSGISSNSTHASIKEFIKYYGNNNYVQQNNITVLKRTTKYSIQTLRNRRFNFIAVLKLNSFGYSVTATSATLSPAIELEKPNPIIFYSNNLFHLQNFYLFYFLT